MSQARLQLKLQAGPVCVSAVELPIALYTSVFGEFIYEWYLYVWANPECCSSSCRIGPVCVSAVELPAPQLSQFSAGRPRVNTSTSKACKRRDFL